jgi:hypothetical protein
MSLTTPDQVTFEGYIVDRVRGSLQWQDDPIAISRKTFEGAGSGEASFG